MKCEKAERLILHFFDGLLSPEEEHNLRKHVKRCPGCLEKEKEYGTIFTILKKELPSEPLPYFGERLIPRLRERRKIEPWSVWKQWSVRVVSVSLVLICILIAVMAFFLPGKLEEMSQSEALLLQNVNPLRETSILFDEKSTEDKNMMLIFYASEEKDSLRRYFP